MKIRKYHAAGVSHIGRRRQENQDRIVMCPEYDFYGVSDGMGGVALGARTATMICESMKEIAKKVWNNYQEDHDVEAAAEGLRHGVAKVSDYVYEKGNTSSRTLFGATFCGVMILDQHIIWVNIGDSRGYVLRKYGKELIQITEDHNLAQALVKIGDMTKEEAAKSGLSANLLNFVGMQAPAIVDTFITKAEENTQIILCSDGLYGMTGDKKIKEIAAQTKSVERCCCRFINAANQQGGKDNISAILIRL